MIELESWEENNINLNKRIVEERINKKIISTIERLENYPCCMSCYLKREEMIAARDMKENLIRILKEELL